MIRSLKGRIHFAHVRNLKFNSPTNFEEAAHLSSDGTFDMYEIVKAQMAIPSNLLENVSYRISEAISAAFPMITALTVTVTKFNPPVSGKAGSSSVTTIKC